jgi:hypothetical protein
MDAITIRNFFGNIIVRVDIGHGTCSERRAIETENIRRAHNALFQSTTWNNRVPLDKDEHFDTPTKKPNMRSWTENPVPCFRR